MPALAHIIESDGTGKAVDIIHNDIILSVPEQVRRITQHFQNFGIRPEKLLEIASRFQQPKVDASASSSAEGPSLERNPSQKRAHSSLAGAC